MRVALVMLVVIAAAAGCADKPPAKKDHEAFDYVEVERGSSNGTILEAEKVCKPASNETMATPLKGTMETTEVYTNGFVFSFNPGSPVFHFGVPCHPVGLRVTLDWEDPYGTAGEWGLKLGDCTNATVSSTGTNPVTLETKELLPSTECALQIVEVSGTPARVTKGTFTWEGTLESRQEAET